MSNYDAAAARQYLLDVIDLCDKYADAALHSSAAGTAAVRYRELRDEVERMRLPTLTLIATISPLAGQGILNHQSPRRQAQDLRTVALRALGVVDEAQRLSQILTPPGPQLAASGFHPWIWDSARGPWADAHRRSAIQAAATRLDTEVQIKLERWDVSGADLAKQAWSEEQPSPGKARLRPPGYRLDRESSKNALNGARALHQAVAAGIRNPASHDLTEPDEQEALERLAALSLLARWVDEADVFR